MSKNSFNMLPGMVVLFAAGLALRLFYAYSLGLWNDEVFTRNLIMLNWREFARFFLNGSDIHPPLYYLVSKALYATLPGNGEFGLKAQNLLYFALSSFTTLWWFARTPALRKPLFFSFVLITFSAVHIYLSSELRMYGLLSALTTVAVLYFQGLRLGDPFRRYAVGSGLLISLALTHYFGILVAFALGVSWLALEGLGKRSVLASAKLLLLPTPLFLAYLPILLTHLRRGMHYQRTWVDAAVYAGKMFNGYAPLVLFVPGVFLFCALTYRHLRGMQLDESDRLFFLAFSSGIIIAIISLAYYLVRGNSVLTFSTFAPLLVLSSYVLGAVLSKMPFNAGLFAAAAFILLSIAPIGQGAADPTYFESNRLPYGNILRSIERQGYRLDGNSLVLNDDHHYTYDYLGKNIHERYGPGVGVVKLVWRRPGTKTQAIVEAANAYPEKSIWFISRGYDINGLQRELRARGFSLERKDKGAALLTRF